MSYKVLGNTAELLDGFEPRVGLEGPFISSSGRVVYYDPIEGKYWDPRTDFYIDSDEGSKLFS